MSRRLESQSRQEGLSYNKERSSLKRDSRELTQVADPNCSGAVAYGNLGINMTALKINPLAHQLECNLPQSRKKPPETSRLSVVDFW